VTHLLKPAFIFLKPRVVDLVVELAIKLRKLWDTHVMAAVKWVADRMKQIMAVINQKSFPAIPGVTSLDQVREEGTESAMDFSPESVMNFVYEVVNEFCRSKAKRLQTQISNLVTALKTKASTAPTGTNVFAAAAESTIADAKNLTKNVLKKWLTALTMDIADKVLTPVLSSTRDFVMKGMDTAKNVLLGLCGLIPEAGAAVCALVTTAAGAADMAVSAALMKGSKIAILGTITWLVNHVMTLVDWVFEKIKGVLKPAVTAGLKAINKMMQVMKPVVDVIKPILLAFVPKLQKRLAECDKLGKSITDLYQLTRATVNSSTTR